MSKSESKAPEGQPTHTPDIRIQGVKTGSPQYLALVDQYRGQLGQFIGKHQQQVALSGQRQYKASKALPDGRMTYQNNEGQETITLVVNPVEGGGEEKIETEEYWKWAVVEMTIPNIQGLTFSGASAFMTPPPRVKEGVALNHTTPYDEENPPLAYPTDAPDYADDLGVFIEDVQDNTYHASLRVHLEPYPGGVKFDVYGRINRYQDGVDTGVPIDPPIRGMYRGANGFFPSGGSYQTLAGTTVTSWFATSQISGRTQTNYLYKQFGTPRINTTEIAAAFPSLPGPFANGGSPPAPYGASWSGDGPSYSGQSIIWTPGSGGCPDASTMNLSALIAAAGGIFTETRTDSADGVSYMLRGIGAQTYQAVGGVESVLNGAGPTDSVGNWGISFFDYTIYYVANLGEVPHYEYPTRDATFKFAVMDDKPFAMTNRYGSPLKDNTFRWEVAKKYPERWKLKDLGSVSITATTDPVDTSRANHFGMTKLGTIIIHPKKGKGGIKFIAA